MNPSDFQDLLETISLVLEDQGDGELNLIPLQKQIWSYAKAVEHGDEELNIKKLNEFAKKIKQIIDNNMGLTPQRTKELENIMDPLEEIIKQVGKGKKINIEKLFDISSLVNGYAQNRFKFDPNNSNISPEQAAKRLELIRQNI